MYLRCISKFLRARQRAQWRWPVQASSPGMDEIRTQLTIFFLIGELHTRNLFCFSFAFVLFVCFKALSISIFVSTSFSNYHRIWHIGTIKQRKRWRDGNLMRTLNYYYTIFECATSTFWRFNYSSSLIIYLRHINWIRWIIRNNENFIVFLTI